MPSRRFKTPSLSTIEEGHDSQQEEEFIDKESITETATNKRGEDKMEAGTVEDKAIGNEI